MSERPYIPFNLPTIGQEEIQEVIDTLKSGWLTTVQRLRSSNGSFRTTWARLTLWR